GCDPFAQTQRSKLQHRRARINQQINKEMRMRAGAENLFATTNNKVKETVALELSFVNSNLQLLKEELEELNSNMEAYQTDEAVNVPMIPLGLKETKEVDFTVSIQQDFICDHYGEDSSLYDKEIKELMELRQQAMRTPSRNQAGLELLMEYYNQLYYLDQRFFPAHRNLGVQFHYDSLTGVPSCQRALAFEKGSVLFNIGALYTQIGARQDRSATCGIDRAIDAFQRAAAFNYLKENFSNAPSLDMSCPSLCMLVRLMVAQQECVFEHVTLTTQDTHFTSQLCLAQEAARVSDVYLLVQQTMTQPLMKDYVPFSWASMVQVKSEHFRALSHYYAAAALCDHVKAHLRCAVIRHEEALRVHSLCKILRKMDILQDVLSLTHKRSLDKYSELDREDDFDETAEAPEIQHTHRKPDITPPNFSTVQVTDIFQRLGPLSVFCARARWGPVRLICLQRREGGLGLTLRGDSPVLVAGVIPGGCAEAGLREGDYIVAVDGQDCKWAKHGEVVHMLKSCSDKGVEISVVTLHSHDVERRAILPSHSINKENTRQRLLSGAKGQSSASLLNWNRKKKREGSGVTKRIGSTFSLSFGSIRDTEAMY
uniref:Rhophilin Rho GTPase binding protein 1 n=1 Tax=Stegastes partitus TaxID=144197 RepID=A0A3B4ZQI0_9TELE